MAPSLLARLLFGSDLNPAGEATGRVGGLVILCLAAGCWPRAAAAESHALMPLTALSWLAAAFLIVTGLIGANVGILLWPAAALHLILAILLTRAWVKAARGEMTKRRAAEGLWKRFRRGSASRAPEGLERNMK